MKKAILGVGIAWGILCIILASILLPIGVLATSPEVIQQVVNETHVTQQQAQEAALVLQLSLYITSIWLLIGAAFSFVLLGIRNKKIGKGGGIALGCVGIAVWAVPTGILFLIDSVKNR